MLTNKIFFVMDASGSMAGLIDPAIKFMNSSLETIKKENSKNKQYTEVSVITFDYYNNIRYVRKDKNIKTIKPITREDYHAGGSTALFDATATAINDGLDHDDGSTSYVVIAITDGYENDSKVYPQSRPQLIKKLFEKAQNSRRWTITFQVPLGNKINLERLGISNDNIREWEATEKGMKEATTRTSVGFTNYFNSRSAGAKSLGNFYVETDLSHLTPRTLKRELTDVSGDFAIYHVSRADDIKNFVEDKTGVPYKKGVAFYQLTKTETVQSNKDIIILDKASLAIYGGDEARELIGLPPGQNAKVKPGDHANYEIFVKSTSVNRKLIAGTKLAVQT